MHLYSNDLLLPYHHTSSQWTANDSQELYQLNLSRQPQNWYYRANPVHYSWNSNGYRAPEWNTINWTASTVVLGCSFVLGTGVDDQDCLSAHISNGVNLGQAGVSADNILYNTVRLIDNGIRPNRVVVVAPSAYRTVYWAQADWVDLTPHDLESRAKGLNPYVESFYRSWLAIDPNAELRSYLTLRSIRALWQSQGLACDIYHSHLVYNKDYTLGPQLPEPIDLARDIDSMGLAHPGRNTFKLWADIIG